MDHSLEKQLSENYYDIIKKVARQAGRADWVIRACGIMSGLILPTVIGLIAGFHDNIFKDFNTFLIWGAALIVVQMLFGFVTTFNLVNVGSFQLSAAAMKEAFDSFIKSYREEAENGKILGGAAVYTDAYLSAMPIYALKIKADNSQFREAVSEIMDYFVVNRDSLFNIKRGELWNFALYLHDKNTELLIPVWRKAASSLWDEKATPAPRASRAFGKCDGHIGAAFRNNETIVTIDAHHSAVAALARPPARLRKDGDEDNYRSFISIPLESGNSLPLGVLVATNNKVETFTPKNCIGLRTAAHILARLASELDEKAISTLALPYVRDLEQNQSHASASNEPTSKDLASAPADSGV